MSDPRYVMENAPAGPDLPRGVVDIQDFIGAQRTTIKFSGTNPGWPLSRPTGVADGMIDYDSTENDDAWPPEAAIMTPGDRWVPFSFPVAGAYDLVFDGAHHVVKPGEPTGAPPDPSPFPVAGVGGVVYSAARIAAWTTGSEYTRLLGNGTATSQGNPSRAYTTVPSTVNTTDTTAQVRLAQFNGDAVWARVQAIASVADPDGTRKALRISRVTDWLDMYATVKPIFEVNTSSQTQRLNLSWIVSNMIRAARIIGYTNSDLTDWLVDYVWNPANTAQAGPTNLDWSMNGNWHATAAEDKLAIAVFAGDVDLWANARVYYRTRIAQSIYHDAHDPGGAITPLRGDNGAVSSANTVNHWGQGNRVPSPQVASPQFLANFPDGTNCERTRDHGHVCMSMTSWVNGAFTILAQGETLEVDEQARLVEFINYHAQRVNPYFEDGTMVSPWPIGNNQAGDTTPGVGGLGGSNASSGWYAAKELLETLGETVSADLTAICLQDEVVSYSPFGANHLGSDKYAFGS